MGETRWSWTSSASLQRQILSPLDPGGLLREREEPWTESNFQPPAEVTTLPVEIFFGWLYSTMK